MKGINGWLLVYLLGSLPLQAFFAAGLSGWIYDYPIPLFVAILVVLLAPLVLLVLMRRSAPAWNIALVWSSAGLITARILYGVFLQGDSVGAIGRPEAGILIGIPTLAVTWAVIWTMYFRKSKRVAASFA